MLGGVNTTQKTVTSRQAGLSIVLFAVLSLAAHGQTHDIANRAVDADVPTAHTRYYPGLEDYRNMGYVPEDKSPFSVSKTLEYAYDDWCIAQMAKKLNRTDVYNEFIKRSHNWKNVYDASTSFMRPKLSDGTFRKDFDELKTHDQGFIEGNAWNYSLYVPHNPSEMIEMLGGKKKFAAHLDELFTMHLPDEFFAGTEEITREGIIGNYVHGNEPSHHVAYLYNWTDAPWKTEERVRMILKKQYRAAPDGLGGNDDCGQMSAWFIFSTLGFYPVAPSSDQYALGSPAIKSATLRLENGRTLMIEAVNQSDKNVYVQKVMVNGQPLKRNYITHAEHERSKDYVLYERPAEGVTTERYQRQKSKPNAHFLSDFPEILRPTSYISLNSKCPTQRQPIRRLGRGQAAPVIEFV